MNGRQMQRWTGWGLAWAIALSLWLAPPAAGAAPVGEGQGDLDGRGYGNAWQDWTMTEATGLDAASRPGQLAVFQVDSTGDEVDASLTDGVCATAGGQCTLRAAIEQANYDGGGTVVFTGLAGIPTIQVGATGNGALPTLTAPIMIDGTTAGGGFVELDGSSAGSTNGLRLLSGGSVLKGLVINRFNGAGIYLQSSSNLIEGNRIGTSADGAADMGNSSLGVWINGSSVAATNNTIRNNLISGNGSYGIYIYGVNASANAVEGNYVGSDVTGNMDLRNDGHGVVIWDSAGNQVGGTAPQQRNVISANNGDGVLINGLTSTGNLVQGNYVGTNAAGTAALPNVGRGIYVYAPGNTIGGQADKASGACTPPCNLVSANTEGIFVGGSSNLVQGNFVGTDVLGAADLGNSSYGIVVDWSSTQNMIGGPSSAEGNVIAFNLGGVRISGSDSIDNSILSNAIWANDGLGIDLGGDGVTPNDPGDPDTGPNQLQNYPVLNSVITGPPTPSAVIAGTLDSTPSTTFRLDFFYDEVPNLIDEAEGRHYLGSADVTTDSGGEATFTVTVPTMIPAANFVTATATDPDGNTSEFSAGRIAIAETMLVIDPWMGGRLVYTDTSALTTTVDVPPGAVTQTLLLALQPMVAPTEPPLAGLRSGDETFDLSAYLGNTELPGFVFLKPLTVTLRYTDEDVFGIVEQELRLYFWDGSTWRDAADTCSPQSIYQHDMAANVLQVEICHLTEWNIQGPEMFIWRVHLPVVVKDF